MRTILRNSRVVGWLAAIALLSGCAGGETLAPSASAAVSDASSNTPELSTPTPEPPPELSAPVTHGPAVLVRGTEDCMASVSVPSPDPSGKVVVRDAILTCHLKFNDPRVNGTAFGTFALDGWGTVDDTAFVEWGTLRLENDGGAWEAQWAGVYTSETGDMIRAWWEGSGGYAGLTFFEWVLAPPGTVVTGYSVAGLIFPGSPPTPP